MRPMMSTPLLATALLAVSLSAAGQMHTGKDMPGYERAFGLEPVRRAQVWSVRQVAVRAGRTQGANVLWPGERAAFTLRFTNRTQAALALEGRLEVIPYATSVPVGDVWVPRVRRTGTSPSVPVAVRIPSGASAEVTVTPAIPPRFGGYALVADMGARGRAFCATLVRVPRPEAGREWVPTYALDLPWPHEMSEAVATLFERLGVKGCRMGAGYYPTTAPDFDARSAQLRQHLAWAARHSITVMLTIGEGGAPVPLGRPRPWLTADDVMMDTKSDYAWLQQYDADFQEWTRRIVSQFGWPRGPVNAVELWNEPWEGISISGWGADLLRFRELYERMALGVEQARRENGVRVLIGGACSSTNTRDKLFPDGSDRFLKWLDFVSIHYQPLAADPALEKAWLRRSGPFGPVRVWDTESWVANSEDRVAAVIASMRAQGQSRTAGIYHGNVYTPEVVSDSPRIGVAQAWAPAAAVAASQRFIGQRPFRRLLFRNGLPWVFVFDGPPGRPDDGTLVVVGDLGGVYDRGRVLFRNVTGSANLPAIEAARKALAGLPPTAPPDRRARLSAALAAAQVVQGARLTLADRRGEFALLDFYGNAATAGRGRVTVPLNGLGYFLRTDGARGSFARLQAAVRAARIDGYTPVDIVAHDMTAPVETGPTLRLAITNVLNRRVSGTLHVRCTGLRLAAARVPMSLAPNATRTVAVRVLPGPPGTTNTYVLQAVFDAGRDGRASHREAIHANLIARRSVVVDGRLDDWRGVPPQPAAADEGLSAGLTETAYLPFIERRAGAAGGAVGYLAADSRYFYFAARIADATPHEGTVRFETRDDDRYFYPATVYTDASRATALNWPDGVRRFSYRMDPDLPSGNGADSVQVAFNVLPQARKTWLAAPPGTMPRFMTYQDTDYEFAFLQVAAKYGGGVEIWRLLAPGMPRKHFYPRQPKAPKDGGPVRDGLLAMTRETGWRTVEAAIPWSVLPDVRAALNSGRTVKFSYRINDNGGEALELAAGRSVSKEGTPSFHNDWTRHWANELEFALEARAGTRGRAARERGSEALR